MPRIVLEEIGLQFRPRNRVSSSVKDLVLHRLLGRALPEAPVVQALSGISVEVRQGERLGVIGHNGAGKTTLLRVLAGIYRPSCGRRLVEGKISSLFEIGLGFEPEATGWENIRFRGYLQQESPRSIAAKAAGIAAFSGLSAEALARPVRYYSSGMLVRLAFAIATAIEPEVLLIDEVLGAGDLTFQQQARARMRELLSRAQVMVLVSHDLAQMAALCERVLWLDHGRMRQLGPAREVLEAYRTFMSTAKNQAA